MLYLVEHLSPVTDHSTTRPCDPVSWTRLPFLLPPPRVPTIPMCTSHHHEATHSDEAALEDLNGPAELNANQCFDLVYAYENVL